MTIVKIAVCSVLSAIGKTDLQIKLRRRKTASFDFNEAMLQLQQSISAHKLASFPLISFFDIHIYTGYVN